MKVMVCGSIGYGHKDEIRKIQEILRREGLDILDQLEWDYSHIDDFRDNEEICAEIVRRDLELCEKADVIVLIAKHPSFGAMAEVVVSAMKGKPIVVFCPEKLKSPWPIYFASRVVRSVDELVRALKEIKTPIRTIPNVYSDHEAEFTYTKFTCICPVTGLRDTGTIKIRYKPKDRILEYESLDTYFKSFADRKMHHEAVVCKIFSDIYQALKPEWLEVVAEFEERSGVKAVIRKRA
ncbi:preQ(1) synthase [Archaeoglobus sp.]